MSKAATVIAQYRTQALCSGDNRLNHVNSCPKSRVPTSIVKAKHTATRANQIYGLRRMRTPKKMARYRTTDNS
jgi:hypothetical protein